jgi:hypothetical protein
VPVVGPQCVRTPVETAGLPPKHGSGNIAKRVEFRSCARVTDTGGNSSVVEHDLAKVGVAGSNPVSRSNSLLIRVIRSRRGSALEAA